MRKILVNALIHRDYSIARGAFSLALFDARVEAWIAGRFPAGITPESLTRAHSSVQRNLIIAVIFHRAGLIEKWGRGTNRVAEMCRATGIAPPEFLEISRSAVVVFRVDVLGSPGACSQVSPQVTLHVATQVATILKAATAPSSA
jgi:ATP-dependent DNA helicase RecG